MLLAFCLSHQPGREVPPLDDRLSAPPTNSRIRRGYRRSRACSRNFVARASWLRRVRKTKKQMKTLLAYIVHSAYQLPPFKIYHHPCQSYESAERSAPTRRWRRRTPLAHSIAEQHANYAEDPTYEREAPPRWRNTTSRMNIT